jgi:hypothetical protein
MGKITFINNIIGENYDEIETCQRMQENAREKNESELSCGHCFNVGQGE